MIKLYKLIENIIISDDFLKYACQCTTNRSINSHLDMINMFSNNDNQVLKVVNEVSLKLIYTI